MVAAWTSRLSYTTVLRRATITKQRGSNCQDPLHVFIKNKSGRTLTGWCFIEDASKKLPCSLVLKCLALLKLPPDNDSKGETSATNFPPH